MTLDGAYVFPDDGTENSNLPKFSLGESMPPELEQLGGTVNTMPILLGDERAFATLSKPVYLGDISPTKLLENAISANIVPITTDLTAFNERQLVVIRAGRIPVAVFDFEKKQIIPLDGALQFERRNPDDVGRLTQNAVNGATRTLVVRGGFQTVAQGTGLTETNQGPSSLEDGHGSDDGIKPYKNPQPSKFDGIW